MSLKKTFADLNKLEENGVITKYAVGGAVAANFYAEPFDAADVDVFVSPEDLACVMEKSWEDLGFDTDPEGNHVICGWNVRFLSIYTTLLREALEQSVCLDVGGVSVRMFTAEHIAAIGCKPGDRTGKLLMTRLLEHNAVNPKRLRDILERHNLLDHWRKSLDSISHNRNAPL